MLTKIEGDARGGAAISIRLGDRCADQIFGNRRSAGRYRSIRSRPPVRRILGMGDILGLIERAEAAYDEKTAREQAEKMISGDFSLQDFADQLRQVRKMGPLGQILDMLPAGWGSLRARSLLRKRRSLRLTKRSLIR